LNVIEALASLPCVLEGRGQNHEGQSFVGRLEVEALVGGKALMLHYVARSEHGEVLHTEATLLAMGQDGNLCLWPVMEELPFLLAHPQVRCVERQPGALLAVFASGPREDAEHFREEITVEVNANSELVYSHAWGMPGGSFAARSSCTFFPAVA
jgi:hypothetical protein